MKKQMVMGLVAALAVSTSVACASPYEMQDGKWNVTMGAMITPDTEIGGLDFDGDTSFYGTVTYGLNDRFGIQLDYSHYGSDRNWGRLYEGEPDFDTEYHTISDLDATELNVVYKLTDHINVFAGYNYTGVDYDTKAWGREYHGWSGHTDGVHAGLMGHYPLGDRLDIFTKLSFGSNMQIRQIGLSYAFADNWAVDVSYRDAEYKDINNIDFEYDGMRIGVSTSF